MTLAVITGPATVGYPFAQARCRPALLTREHHPCHHAHQLCTARI